MSTTRHIRSLRRLGTVCAAALALTPALVADAKGEGRSGPRLAGRAVLPVETYAPGPRSGTFFGSVTTNGVRFPLPSQGVLGFSGIVAGRRPGEYLAMPDNGFGNKQNSFDFLIRAYYLTPDFKTARGGSGGVAVGDFISFRDPGHHLPFPIVNEATADRLLTGADVDPESIQRDHRGDLWLGDEFGPWILHFDGTGRLVEPPIALPDGLVTGTTVNGSRGIEAMALGPNGRTLTVVLEGAVNVVGESPAARRIYQYDTADRIWTRRPDYRVTAPAGSEGSRFVSDAQAIDSHRLLVIERDGGRGLAATYRVVYEIDLNATGADGAVAKRQVLDLAAIPDPYGVSLPKINQGDVGLGDPFRVTCESIEALYVVSHAKLLLGCDNNLPNTGRNPGRADDSEFILVAVPGLR